jgi:hypothetical protein
VELLEPQPTRVKLTAEFRNLFNGDARLYLTPHGVETIAWMMESVKHFAPDPQMHREIDVDAELLKRSPEHVAFLMIEHVYTWFGASSETIPYISRLENAPAVVDVATIKLGGKQH